MKRDIDSVSAELTSELAFTPLEKKLPPKLLYRFRKWMQQYRGKQAAPAQQQIQKAMEHLSAIKTLQKNEMLASFYDNGHIRLDFGGGVDAKVKEAAMKWAKKRGLSASEASLDKSAGAPSYVVMSNAEQTPRGLPQKFIKYAI
jgi:hypothetical protein